MIAVMWVCTDTSYSFVYVNITNIKGNVFVNCIILGAADTFSNVFSGLLMQLMPEENAFQVVGFMGILFSLLLPYCGDSLVMYVCLFLSIGGVGGLVNSMICIVEMQVEPQRLGTVMQLLMTAGSMMSGFSVYYALLPQPLPLIILCFFISLDLAISFMLPEGGRYLTQAIKLSASVT